MPPPLLYPAELALAMQYPTVFSSVPSFYICLSGNNLGYIRVSSKSAYLELSNGIYFIGVGHLSLRDVHFCTSARARGTRLRLILIFS